jgi:hypothetical protein
VTDPFSVAQAAIAKWVGARIAAGLDTALRQRQLRQGRPAPDQQAELAAVMKAAVEQTAAELPDQDRLQGNFRKTLLKSKQRDWPLVNGTDLDNVVSDLYTWILDNDPRPGGGQDTADPAAHPYLQVLSRCVIAQFKFRAMNNGVKNTILYPRWNDFRTTELSTYLQAAAALVAPATESRNDFHGPVSTVIQGQQVIVNDDTAAPVVWPCRFGTVPPLAAARQERAVDQQLTAALTGGGTAVVCQILAGMGGVGKTQIAAAYAQQQWEAGGLDLLVWVKAAGRNEITATLAHAWAALCGADPADSDRAAAAFLAWLDRPEAPRWLIVLDDLTDPADLTDLWPPEIGRGQTIVTTRRRDAALDGGRRTRINVDLFTPDEAAHYLHQRLGVDSGLLEGAADLAEDLGRLPLALAQAAAYILDQPGLTCLDYRRLLADRTVALAELSPDVFPDGYPESVAAAWSLSIESADRHPPEGLASGILGLASLLDPAGIPVALFATEAAIGWLTATATEEADASSPLTDRHVRRVLGRLHRLSLIDSDGTTVRVHALVQRAVRDSLDAQNYERCTRAAADALVGLWPDPENNPATGAGLRANADRLRDHAASTLFTHEANAVLFWAGRSLGECGQVGDAASYFHQLRNDCRDRLGPDHPDTLTARNNLAYWRGRAGDEAGAAGAFAALLDDRMRAQGPDHPDTLTTRNNLARWLGEAGDEAGAAGAFAALLDDFQRVLGPDHPDTLTTRSNLAYWRDEAGDAAGAARAFAALLDDRMRVLGPDHPDTLTTRSNLASWRGRTGDEAGAAESFAALLDDFQRVLGPDHPDTLSTRNDLAYWQEQAASSPDAGESDT